MKTFKGLTAAIIASLMLAACACGTAKQQPAPAHESVAPTTEANPTPAEADSKPTDAIISATETPTQQPKMNCVDALSYEMQLKLDTQKDRLYETVNIKLKNDTDAPIQKLCLRNMAPAALAYAKEVYADNGNEALSAKVNDIRLAGSEASLNVKYEGNDSIIWIELENDQSIPSGETAELMVNCETDIPKRQDRFAVLTDDSGKIYTLSFCFPYLADNENGEWITDPFFDDGESRGMDIADYSVTFEAPQDYCVAATGSNETKDGITTISAEQVRDFAIVACNFMQMEEFEAEGIKIKNYYLTDKDEAEYRKVSRLAAQDSLRIFTQTVGKLPFAEIDIVECLFGFAFGGMEYPGLVMVNGSSSHANMGADFFASSLIDGISHELGHQWFYAAVGNREYTEGWLDEGFTTYLERTVFGLADCETNAYLRKLDTSIPSIESLEQDRNEYLTLFKSKQEQYKLNVSPDNYKDGREYGEGEYDGGYMFLVDLELTFGKPAMMEFLKDYYSKYCLKTVTTNDVKLLINTHFGDKAAEVLKYWLAD